MNCPKCDKELGAMPASAILWKSAVKMKNKEEALQGFFNDLKASDTMGARLAVDYGRRSKAIGKALVQCGFGEDHHAVHPPAAHHADDVALRRLHLIVFIEGVGVKQHLVEVGDVERHAAARTAQRGGALRPHGSAIPGRPHGRYQGTAAAPPADDRRGMMEIRELNLAAFGPFSERLLDFSRTSIPDKQVKSLAAIMENTLALVEHHAAVNDVEIIRHYGADENTKVIVCHVENLADPDDFMQAARKFENETAKLAADAKTGDLDAIKAQFGATAKACKDCHGEFKSK